MARHRNIPILYSMSIFSFAFHSVYLLLLAQYKDVHGYSSPFYGLAIAMNMLALLLVSFPGGYMADRVGRKAVLIAGYATALLAPLMLIYWNAGPGVLLSTAFLGVGLGLSNSARGAITADSLQSDRLSSGFGNIFAVSTLASAVAIFAFEWLIESSPSTSAGLERALWGILALQVLAIAFASLLQETKDWKPKPGLFSDIRFTRVERRVIRDMSITQFVTALGASMTVPYYSIFFMDKFDVDAGELGIIFSIGTLGMAVSQMAAGYVGERTNKLRFITLANLLSIPMATGIMVSTYIWLSATFYVARNSIANMIWPVWMSFYMVHVATSRRGKALGITETFWNLAYIPGSVLGGYLIYLAQGWAFPLAATMYFCVAVFVYLDLKRFFERERVPMEPHQKG